MSHTSSQCGKIDPCDDNRTIMEMYFCQLEMSSSLCFMFSHTLVGLSCVCHADCFSLYHWLPQANFPIRCLALLRTTLGLCVLISNSFKACSGLTDKLLGCYLTFSKLQPCNIRVVMLFIICSFVFPWPPFQSSCCQDAAELPTQKCLER